MDLSLVMENDKTLCMEVWSFDSLQEIREKIEECTGISIYKQTLLFNGQVRRVDAVESRRERDTDDGHRERVAAAESRVYTVSATTAA